MIRGETGETGETGDRRRSDQWDGVIGGETGDRLRSKQGNGVIKGRLVTNPGHTTFVDTRTEEVELSLYCMRELSE